VAQDQSTGRESIGRSSSNEAKRRVKNLRAALGVPQGSTETDLPAIKSLNRVGRGKIAHRNVKNPDVFSSQEIGKLMRRLAASARGA
jgi:hypothetical protein